MHRGLIACTLLVVLASSAMADVAPGAATQPVAASEYSAVDLPGLLKALDTQRAIVADGRSSDERRGQAGDTAAAIARELVRRFGDDPRVHQWQADAVELLLDARIEPTARKMIHGVCSPAERDAAGKSLDRSGEFLAGLDELSAGLDGLERAARFDAAEFDRLDSLRLRMRTLSALVKLYRAQWLWWPRGAALDVKSKVEAAGLCKSAGEFFKPFAVDDALPELRVPARLYLGWAALFTDDSKAATLRADQVIADAAAPAGQKFEAYTLKVQSLIAAGHFGDLTMGQVSGAFAVLEEQAGLLKDPAMKDPSWRALLVLAKANCMVRQAAWVCYQSLDEAYALSKTEPKRAGDLRDKALADYRKARAAAEAVFDAAGETDASIAALCRSAKACLRVDPLLDKDLAVPAGGSIAVPRLPASQPVAVDPPMRRVPVRIVYVIDSSGSMFQTFDYVKAELKRSIATLKPRQQFQVIFFADGPPGELKIAGRADLHHATADNKKAACEWIDQRLAGSKSGATLPGDALKRAFALTPDVIYLLTDGIFPQDTLTLLAGLNKDKKVRINTIAFVDRVGEALLKQIARDHGGQYRFISEDDLGKDGFLP